MSTYRRQSMKNYHQMMVLMFFSFFSVTFIFMGQTVVKSAAVDTIPNTSRTIKDYDQSHLNVTGFASFGVNDRSEYFETSHHWQVKTGKEFLQALLEAKNDKVKIIEVVEDIDLGWKSLHLSSEEAKVYSFVTKYRDPMNGFTNPLIENSGVSQISIANIEGLTIFSKNGKTIKHAELKLQGSSNDIVIRNINFSGMWQWDDTGKHKEVGWSFIKVNGANNVWIDHCTFSIAADGLIDLENGASNVTISWSRFGLEANEKPPVESDIYQSIHFMEEKYNGNRLGEDSVYAKMRNSGATKEDIMAYAAYHSKGHLNGSGDKDYVNYVDKNGVEVKDGNQRIRLTIAYSTYNNVGSRIPMIRQGTGHLYNCYIDNSTHNEVLDRVKAIATHGTDQLSRAMNARNGASIAADTCVFNGINEPIIGAEIQGLDTKNMNEPWDKLFQNAYNNNLIVNSQITNEHGTYTGSSWDQDGENLFTKGFIWHDKATIGKWAWSSHIVGSEEMSKNDPPLEPFRFKYRYDEILPYTYQVIPLNRVKDILSMNAGAGKVDFLPEEWVKTNYSLVTIGDLIQSITKYEEEGDISSERAAHELTLHLKAVEQYEQKKLTDKVVKHMEGFQILLDYQKQKGDISERAYHHLEQKTKTFIDNLGE